MIGKNNIEEKLFDYFEGDLSANEAKELENFVKDNPEYQVDFDAWQQSVVQAENVQYQHADDLLVKEKSSPKGWLRWASGGALLCLISVASVGLVTKYEKGKEVIADLEESQTEKVISEEIKENSASVIARGDSKSLNESVLIENNLEESEVSLVKSSTINVANSNGAINRVTHRENRKKYINTNIPLKSDADVVKNDDPSVKFENPSLKNEEGINELLTGFNVSALQEGSYEFMLPFAMKKDKTPYENPNQPKIFITNNKDPYLNYNLGHTLEENASFAGNGGEGTRVEYLYRTEWPSVTTDNFSSQILSVDGYVGALNAGIGFIINADRLGHGALNGTSGSLIYSQKILIGGVSFEPSLKGTYNERSITWGRIETNDIKDPRNGVLYGSVPFVPEGVPVSRMSHFDLGLGMLVNAKKFYIGGQVDHINGASYSNEYFNQTIKIPAKISAMAGTDIYKKQGGKVAFSPSVNYVKFGNYNALWLNTQLAYQGFFVATAFATNEELMASLGYKNNLVRLTYGLGFSKPSEFSGLEATGEYHESHQVSLRVNLHQKK